MNLNLMQTHKLAKADRYCDSQTPVTVTEILDGDITVRTNNNKVYTARFNHYIAVGELPSIAITRLISKVGN